MSQIVLTFYSKQGLRITFLWACVLFSLSFLSLLLLFFSFPSSHLRLFCLDIVFYLLVFTFSLLLILSSCLLLSLSSLSILFLGLFIPSSFFHFHSLLSFLDDTFLVESVVLLGTRKRCSFGRANKLRAKNM